MGDDAVLVIEPGAERSDRVRGIVRRLAVRRLDAHPECAVITGRYRMLGALDIRRVLRRG
nr:MAG TPA: hypothetical protein [Caudoviricetes sp.]